MIPDLPVGLNDELEWMMSENARITEEVSYLRHKMMELFQNPAYKVEISQPKKELHAEIVKYVE